MKKIFYLLLLFSFQLNAQTDNRLMLHSGAVQPEANLEQFIASPVPAASEIFNGYYYRFIQFNSLPAEAQKDAIAQTGIVLLGYLPHRAFMAAIPVGFNKTELRNLNVRAVVLQNNIHKINTKLLAGVPSYARVEKGFADVRVQYFENIPSASALAAAQQVGTVLSHIEKNHVITLRIAENGVQSLSQLAWVYFIDAVSPASVPDDSKGRSLHRSNNINTDYPMGRHYNGSGVAAALADDGTVGPHIDFTGRLTDHNSTPGGFHGDMTGGILAGAGNLNPTIRGMADGVQLHVWDIGGYPQIIDAVSNNTTYGTVISSTSYSQGCNEYTTDTQFGDQTTRDNPQLMFVFSAGNNGGGDCGYGAGAGWGNVTGGYKQGKNVIACANLDALEVRDNTSSRGPASDGRIKPDISANGKDQMSTDENNTYQVGGGTSAACPGIAGISTQLIQAYKELTTSTDAPTALIKACLLNSAEDIGNAGPDFTYGYGRVNALRAVQTLEDNSYIFNAVSQGGSNTHNITVGPNVTELRVMVYWHDEGGDPVAAIALVNDLDMTVTDPSSASWLPWVLDPTPTVAAITSPATRTVDHLNNMEQVTIDNPVAGTYVINITGFAVPAGPQEYYVVYETRSDVITPTYPMGGEGFVPGETEVLRWDALKGLGSFTLEYSTDNGANWNLIANNVSQNTLQYSWVVPNTPTGEALVRVTRGAVSGISTEKFTIVGLPTNIDVDWVCPDSVRLTWTGVPNASWYEVSMLGALYMDSVGTSATTDFIVTGINPNLSHWFSVRAVMANGGKGRRANAIYQSPGVANCPLALDVQLNLIVSPGGGTAQDCQGLTNVSVTLEIENRGINTVSNIPLAYRLNGGAVVNDIYTGTLSSFQVGTHTFPSTVDLSVAGIYTLEAWIDYPGDMNLYNDSLNTVTTVIGGTLASIPFVEDFESFNLCSTNADCEATVCPPANGWINETNLDQDDIDMRTNEGSTPSVDTGPDVDHTTGTPAGNYMYTEASGGCTGRIANFMSPCIDLTTATAPQMVFWYHMYGATIGSLHVDIFSNGTWIIDAMLPISGDHGNSWQQAAVSLVPYAGQTINVRFRAITGTDFTSDIAIDDINILETNAPPVVQFTVDNNTGCVGKTFTFTDLSLNAPTSWQWTFNPSTVVFVNGTSATSQNPQVQFTAAGFYDVSLTATNSFGSNAATQPNYVVISNPVTIPLVEDFQSGTFPPAGWNLLSAGGAYTWEEAAGITGYSGTPTTTSYINNFTYNNPGAEDALETFQFDMTGASAPEMTFDVAYARYSAVFTDTLRIDISTDCGATYPSFVYYKGGTDLATVPDNMGLWQPASAAEWRKDSVDLSAFAGNNLTVKFVNINGYGNSLYIDNINVYDVTSIIENNLQASVSITPNPSNGLFNLSIQSLNASHYELQLYDVKGQLISDRNLEVNGTYKSQIDLRNYAKGVYMLSIRNNEGIYRTRIVVL